MTILTRSGERAGPGRLSRSEGPSLNSHGVRPWLKSSAAMPATPNCSLRQIDLIDGIYHLLDFGEIIPKQSFGVGFREAILLFR